MSDTAPTPGTGPGFPTFSGDAAPQPSIPATAELRREEVARIMHSPDYLSDHEHVRAPLVRRVRELMSADHPTDTRPRNEITGMVEAEPPPAPPVPPLELQAKLSNNLSFPTHVSMDDRAAFLDVARDGLAALGASHAEAGHFIHGMNDALRAEPLTIEAAEATMRREWGASYEANMQAARAALRVLPPHVKAQMTEVPEIGNSPAVLRLLATAGRRMQARR